MDASRAVIARCVSDGCRGQGEDWPRSSCGVRPESQGEGGRPGSSLGLSMSAGTKIRTIP